jgi:hypothetical protein
VHEAVVAAVLRRDEAIALVRVEEFYGADRHGICPFQSKFPRRRASGAKVAWKGTSGRTGSPVAGDDSET